MPVDGGAAADEAGADAGGAAGGLQGAAAAAAEGARPLAADDLRRREIEGFWCIKGVFFLGGERNILYFHFLDCF